MTTLLVAIAACSGADDVRVPDAPTFRRDVAPIVFEHCADCHRPGQSAPFSLVSYRDVEKRSRQIAEVVASRFMPPWLPEPGSHEFLATRRLSEVEIETLRRWHATGAPEGAAVAPPEPPRWQSGWTLGEPDLILVAEAAYPLAADGADEFRNLVLPVPISKTRYVRAFELRPGGPTVVHHAILAVDRAGECRRLAAEDGAPGFPGMGMETAAPPDGHFLGWTPGKVPQELPSDMAWRLYPGDDLVLQLHMTKTGKPEFVQPSIGLYFTGTAPTRFPHTVVLYEEDIDIPAGAVEYRVRDTFRLPVAVDVLGVYPHAHYLGRSVRGVATLPNGDVDELLRIDAWNFDWQDEYRFTEPVSLPAGTELSMEWVYDNSAGNPRNPNQPPERVRFGESSADEMGTLSILVLPRDPAAIPELEKARWEHTLRKKPYDWAAFNSLGVILAGEGRPNDALEQFRAALQLRPDYPDALSNLGLVALNSGRPATALAPLERALAIDPDHRAAITHYGRVLAALGRSSEALEHFRRALARRPNLIEARLDYAGLLALSGASTAAVREYRELIRLRPDLPEAHNNLANSLFTLDILEEATEHYRRALSLRPNYFNARFNLGRVLIARGRLDEGVTALEAARAERPGDPAVRAELERVRELARGR